MKFGIEKSSAGDESSVPLYVQRILNKIIKPFKETFAGVKGMFQGFRIYFVWNPSIKGIESTS